MPILLITPPLLQPNTPYPATACLAGFLRTQGFAASQADLSLDLLCALFSSRGIRRIESAIRARRRKRTPAVRHFLAHAQAYRTTIDDVILFLQGRNNSCAAQIASRLWLPEGPRFEQADSDAQDFDTREAATHLASLYLDDLADAIREGVDPHFGFARYAEHLAVSAIRFDPLLTALNRRPTLTDRLLDSLTDAALAASRPNLVVITIPFPGTLYGGLRIAQRIRRKHPRIRIALGGGYVNTELRDMDDPRLFDLVDYLCFDDGELPLLRIAESMRDKIRSDARLVRTCVRRRNQVVRLGFEQEAAGVTKPSRACRASSDAPPPASILPGYEDLPLDRYISLAESTNPMHRLWSDGRWLKLPLAHGCYWSQCQFCDTSLDYIRRYVPPRPDNVVDRMIELQRRTGLSGFHFTDEALAPALLKRLAERLIARRVQSVWWGNIRLESGFTSELARLLAEAGCVAVTGGLECATDRLLALMNKGITLRMAARACKAFTRAGILTHAYLMYDFPTQTAQEVSDGLEYVRQLFERGALHSAYWHRFALTCHSPIAANPSAFGIRVLKPRKKPERTFACNELGYELLNPAAATLPPAIGEGLRRAVYNYMRGAGLDRPIPSWFDAAMPRPKLNRDFVRRA